MIEKLRTLAGSAVTWLLFVQTTLTTVVTAGAAYADVPLVAKAVAAATVGLTWVAFAIKLVSSLTPVPPEVRGLERRHPLDVAAAIKAEYQAEQQSFWGTS